MLETALFVTEAVVEEDRKLLELLEWTRSAHKLVPSVLPWIIALTAMQSMFIVP